MCVCVFQNLWLKQPNDWVLNTLPCSRLQIGPCWLLPGPKAGRICSIFAPRLGLFFVLVLFFINLLFTNVSMAAGYSTHSQVPRAQWASVLTAKALGCFASNVVLLQLSTMCLSKRNKRTMAAVNCAYWPLITPTTVRSIELEWDLFHTNTSNQIKLYYFNIITVEEKRLCAIW